MRLHAWGSLDDKQPSRLQRVQAVADIALMAFQRLDALITTHDGPSPWGRRYAAIKHRRLWRCSRERRRGAMRSLSEKRQKGG